MILVTIQIIKRVYETQKINVFSDGKINISHYLVGYFHYCGLIAVILGESKGFHKGRNLFFKVYNFSLIKIL